MMCAVVWIECQRPVSDSGGRDFWGTTVPISVTPDVGAYGGDGS